MATVRKLTLKSGSTSYRAIIKAGGKQVASKCFARRNDAVAWARRLEADRERMTALGQPGGSKLFREVAAMVLAIPAKDVSRELRVRWWVDRIGAKAIGRIETADLRQHLDAYAADHAPASVNRLRAAVSAVFRHAVREGWLTGNPAKGLAHRTEPKGIVRWLEPDERTRLLAACDASPWPKLGLLVRFLLGTGARLGEAMALRWCDLDLIQRRAYLAVTKNGDARVLVMPETLVAALRQHRAIGAALVFGREDDPSKPFHFRKHWNAARTAAGMPDLRLHDCRHDVASQLVMNGATLHEVGQVLGHRSVQTSARYAHLSIGHKQALVDRVLGNKLS